MRLSEALKVASRFMWRRKFDFIVPLLLGGIALGVIVSNLPAEQRSTQTIALVLAAIACFFLVGEIYWFAASWVFRRWSSVEPKRRLKQLRLVAAVFGLAPFFRGATPEVTIPAIIVFAGCILLWPMAIAVAFSMRHPGFIVRLHAIATPQSAPVLLFGLAVPVMAGAMFAWSEGIRLVTMPRAELTTMDSITMVACLVGSLAVIVVPTVYLLFWQPADKREIGNIVQSARDGWPRLEWSQLAGSMVSEAHDDARGRLAGYVGIILIGAVAGLSTGSWESMALGALLAAWLGAFGLRGADKLTLQGNTLKSSPHQTTPSERREEMTPLTVRQDCAAYLEVHDGVLMFVLEQGDRDAGTMQVVDRVPLDSFPNFEEGSHHDWFRSKISTSEVRDWGVIVAQSSIGRVVLVAQSVNDKAWLIELLVRLQKVFIEPRDALLQAVEDTRADAAALQQIASGLGLGQTEDTTDAVPRRRF